MSTPTDSVYYKFETVSEPLDPPINPAKFGEEEEEFTCVFNGLTEEQQEQICSSLNLTICVKNKK